MNDRMPPWTNWNAPAPSPYFDQRVWQKLEAARAAQRPEQAWWERGLVAATLAGATALLLVSIHLTAPAHTGSLFTTVAPQSLTHAYVDALHRR